jgi:hypothetical protein
LPKGLTLYIRERGGTKIGEMDKETTIFISKENGEMKLEKSTKDALTKSSSGKTTSSHYTRETSFRRDNRTRK